MKRLLWILIFLMLLVTACTGLPERLDAQSYVSAPQWSSGQDFQLETNFGSIRVFNNSNWELDIALLEEIINDHGVSFTNALELRILDSDFVQRDPTNGFISSSWGEIGLTMSFTDQYNLRHAWVLIPTGWAEQAGLYNPSCPNLETIITSPEGYLTMDIVHELIVHGLNRASGIEKNSQEECVAQTFDRQVFESLAGRNLVRK